MSVGNSIAFAWHSLSGNLSRLRSPGDYATLGNVQLDILSVAMQPNETRRETTINSRTSSRSCVD